MKLPAQLQRRWAHERSTMTIWLEPFTPGRVTRYAMIVPIRRFPFPRCPVASEMLLEALKRYPPKR